MKPSEIAERLTGKSLIGTRLLRALDQSHADATRTFRAVDPATGSTLEPPFFVATEGDVERATRLASEAFYPFSESPGSARAELLERIAVGLDERRDLLVARAMRETALPEPRLEGEVARAAGQLRMYAALVREDTWRDPRIDRGDADRLPTPKPDLRSMRRALGPVAVFGASNFPFAFSVAGGDTAAALAAGCPVVVKAHPGHPGTSELVAMVIADAARASGLPEGVFSLLLDDGHDVGVALVQSPHIRAVGFTGSRAGGEALTRIAASRAVPIPVYAEMGSVNPVFVLPVAAREQCGAISKGLHESFTLGVGQFCTNPGVVFVPHGEAGDELVRSLAHRVEATPEGTMLNARVCELYGSGLDALLAAGGSALARGAAATGPTSASAAVWEVGLDAVRASPALLAEVFGPSTVIVRYDAFASLIDFARTLEGQLTATIHAAATELDDVRPLASVLADRAGRVLFGGFPTGVEVSPAMVHGGPFPATSDGRSTSVGTYAIERFTRLVAYQNAPQELLPEALRDR